MVITDGSGHHGVSRLESTTRVLSRTGARPGAVFGRLTDAAVYRALLDRQHQVFTGLADEIADAIVGQKVGVVAGDDAEGFNPTHDVCRLIINTAVRLVAEGRAGTPLANLAFNLMERISSDKGARNGKVEHLRLDDGALERKLTAALDYPELAGEVATARARWGDEAFRTETFRHADTFERWTPGAESPFYERYGTDRVSAGVYRELITYEHHIQPLTQALAAHRRQS
jgi:hypothetical protein